MMTQVDEGLIEHMSNPKNYGTLTNADAIGVGENPSNGEMVIIQLRVDNSSEIPMITDIRYQSIGCMTTVVAGSIITGEAKGVGFERAKELIAVTLGMLNNVPPKDAACTEMVVLALKAAMDTYTKKQHDPDFGTITYQIENSCETNTEETPNDKFAD